MAHIRDDLVGSVYLHTGGPAGPVVLVAGDEVPEGFEVGAHLLADEEPVVADDFTNEGGVVDESGDPDASEGPELEVEPGPADGGAGTPLPKPSPARRAHRNRG